MNGRQALTDWLYVPQGEGRHLVLFFLLMTGKFYTLGIMRSLNSRPELRGRMTSDDIGRTSLSDWRWDDEHRGSDARRSSEVRLSSLCFQCSCDLVLKHNVSLSPRRRSLKQRLRRVSIYHVLPYLEVLAALREKLLVFVPKTSEAPL
jgi:hypothetical protein